MKKISTDINYSTQLLNQVFKCKKCKQPLLMDGCGNPDCDNYYINKIKEEQ